MTNPMKCKCGDMPAWRYFPASSSERQFMCYSCGISGPYNDPDHVGWDALMGGDAKLGEETVRVPTQIAYAASSSGSWPFVLANDGTMWGMPDGLRSDGEWHLIPALPTPADVKGDMS